MNGLLLITAGTAAFSAGYALGKITHRWTQLLQHVPGGHQARKTSLASPFPSSFPHFQKPPAPMSTTTRQQPNRPGQPRFGRDMKPCPKPLLMQHGQRGTLSMAGPASLDHVEDVARIGFKRDERRQLGPTPALWTPFYTTPTTSVLNEKERPFSHN